MTRAAIPDRALTRIVRFTIAAGAAGTIAVLAMRGPRIAAGFLVGAVISLLNFHWLRRMVENLGSSENAPRQISTAFFAFRYLLVGAAVYVIVKFLGVALGAVLAGLFVSAAAVILEILYELIFSP